MTSDYIHLIPSSDVDVDKPDEKSIMTYVAQFLKHHPDRGQSDSDGQPEEEVTSCHIYRRLDTPVIVFSHSVSCVFCLSLQMSQLVCQTSAMTYIIDGILSLFS